MTFTFGKPLPYGQKVAARYIARVNVSGYQPRHGLLVAMNHNVVGYGQSTDFCLIQDRPEEVAA